jgi:hypothetical protein
MKGRRLNRTVWDNGPHTRMGICRVAHPFLIPSNSDPEFAFLVEVYVKSTHSMGFEIWPVRECWSPVSEEDDTLHTKGKL